MTPGLKYELHLAADASRQKPIVVVPEVSFGGSPNYWSVATSGSLTNRSQLGRLIEDTLTRLGTLGHITPGSINLEAIRRLFLAGHSGGGVPLAAA